MADETFAERPNQAARTSRWGRPAVGRAFQTAHLVAFVALAVGVSSGDENGQPTVKTGVAVTTQDDARLWRAGTSCDYFHNRALVLPEEYHEHAVLLATYMAAGDERRTLFATTIKDQDVASQCHRILVAAEQSLQTLLVPSVLAREEADEALKKWFEGRMPAWPLAKFEGGVVPSVDELRKVKVATNKFAIQRHRINTAIADQVEARYREALGGKTLPEEAGLYFRNLSFGKARIAYAGSQPLTNVVVVARTEMRLAGLKEEATLRLVDLINETADPGADANKDAANLVHSSHVLHETPQSAFIYVPVLEPGDDLVLEMYEDGFHYDALKAKVSLYCDAGAVLDKVLFVGGPHNDLSLLAEERKRLL